MPSPRTLRYVAEGSPDQPPLLFLHGFLGRGADWSDVAGHLADRFYCICPDLPGHGGSTGLAWPVDYDMAGAARGVTGVLDELGVSRCGAVGYSMGGRLALWMLVHGAGRFSGCVLESASPGIEDQNQRRARRAEDERRAENLESCDLGTFVRQWYEQPLFATLHRDRRRFDALVTHRMDNHGPELARSLRAMGAGAQASLWPRLPGLSEPVVAVAGALDGKYVDVVSRMAGLSERIQAAIVPGAGHNVHVEETELFVQLVDSAFAK